MKNLIVCMF